MFYPMVDELADRLATLLLYVQRKLTCQWTRKKDDESDIM